MDFLFCRWIIFSASAWFSSVFVWELLLLVMLSSGRKPVLLSSTLFLFVLYSIVLLLHYYWLAPWISSGFVSSSPHILTVDRQLGALHPVSTKLPRHSQNHCSFRVWAGVRLVSRGTSVWICFSSPFSFTSKVVVCGHCLVMLSLTINETLKWLSLLPVLMQESFWWWQCSDRYIISLFPHLHTPLLPVPNKPYGFCGR